MPVIVIVGLFGGFGTLVEAGAIAVVYSFIVECFILRGFSLRRDFPRVAVECVTVVGGVLLIIGVAKGLTYYLAIQDVPGILTNWVDVHIHSKYVFLLLLNVVLLIKGSFMDVFSAIIVMVPLIQPDCREVRHRPGADGRDLPGQPGTRIPHASYRHEPVSLRLPLQTADDRRLPRHAPVLLDPAGRRVAHHLCARADHAAGEVAGPVSAG